MADQGSPARYLLGPWPIRYSPRCAACARSTPANRFPEQEINERLIQLNRSVKFTPDEVQNLLGLEYQNRQTFLVLSLLYPNFDFSNGFHVDHVYPRSKMTERRLLAQDVIPEDARAWPDMRDNLANLQLLQGGPNKSKSNSDFDEWLDQELGDKSKEGIFSRYAPFPELDDLSLCEI